MTFHPPSADPDRTIESWISIAQTEQMLRLQTEARAEELSEAAEAAADVLREAAKQFRAMGLHGGHEAACDGAAAEILAVLDLEAE